MGADCWGGPYMELNGGLDFVGMLLTGCPNFPHIAYKIEDNFS